MARSPSTLHDDDDDSALAIDSNDQFVAELSGRLSKALILKKKAQQELSEYKAENAELRKLLDDVGEKHKAKKAQFAVKTENVQTLVQDMEDAQAQLELKDQRIYELEAECVSLRQRVEKLQEQLSEAQQETSNGADNITQQMLHESNLEVIELRCKVNQLESKNEDLQSQVDISGGQLQTFQTERDALQETLLQSKLESERVVREKDQQIAQLQQRLNQQQAGLQSIWPPNTSGPNSASSVSQQAQSSQPNSLTIVIPPRPSVPFEESFRISVTQSRREAFRQNPLFIDLCHALPEGATFTRGYLMDKIGGAGQGVVARVANKKSLSLVHDVGLGVLYPQPNLNSWLPAMPGAHGYMFVGLKGPGKDHERFLESAKWSLFLPKNGKAWEYYGEYEVHRQPDLDLTMEEWEEFSLEFRKGYAECTAKKENPHGELNPAVVQSFQDKYDKGTLRVPCTALKCVGYNRQLVLDLVSPPPGLVSSVKRTATETPQGTPKSKRKKARTSPK